MIGRVLAIALLACAAAACATDRTHDKETLPMNDDDGPGAPSRGAPPVVAPIEIGSVRYQQDMDAGHHGGGGLGGWLLAVDVATGERLWLLKVYEVTDDSAAGAHSALATVLRDRGDYAGAAAAYQKALELDPQSAEIRDQYAQYLLLVGRFDEGLAEERRAMALDPLAPDPHLQMGLMLLMWHRYDEARAQFAEVLKVLPEHGIANMDMAFIALHQGDAAAAEAYARAGAATVKIDADTAAVLIQAAAQPALRAAALGRVENLDGRNWHIGRPPKALWYLLLGEPARAVEATESWAASVSREQAIIDLYYFDSPFFDPIRSNSRFRAALEKAGLPATAIEAAAEAPK